MNSEILYKLGRLFAKIRIYRFFALKNKIVQLIYSGYYARQLALAGHKFRLHYPVRFINGPQYIRIGDYFNSFSGLRMEAIAGDNVNINKNGEGKFLIEIGNNVSFNNNCQVTAVCKIVIKDGCLFASNVFVTDHYHGQITHEDMNIRPSLREIYSKGPVILEENVWVGQNVSIMPNVTIGKCSIIGANSVVTRDIPPFSVAAGVPAKIIKCMSHED